MPGTVYLYNRIGEEANQKTFKWETQIDKIIYGWKKLYGKGFSKCKIQIVRDEKPIKTKPIEVSYSGKRSPFKKGPSMKTYSVRRTHRNNYPNMDRH